ncbi:MAG: hypothetical protein ABGX22_05785 [Pirellulaceae bacterium]
MSELTTNERASAYLPTALYYMLWTLIVAVSVHDGYLVLLNRWTIAVDEMNPVGRWLIATNGGDVRFLLITKLTGTIVAAAILLILYWRKPRLAWIICPIVAVAQTGLAVYLTSY